MLPEEEAKEVGPVSIKDAIDQATKDLKGEKEEEKEEKKEAAPKETEKEEEKDEEEDENDLSEEEQAHALNLFRALKDPTKGPIVLEAMAKEAGLTKNATKEEKREVAETIESILERHLGADFPTLAKILTPAIREAVKLEAENLVKPVRESVQRDQDERTRRSVESAQDEAFGRFENADDPKMLKEVSTLMDQIKPAKGISAVKYFNTLILTAADNLGIDLKRKSAEKKEEKVSASLDARRERNRNDAKSNLESKDKTTVGKTVQPGKDAKPMSAKDAVELAMQQIGKR